MVGRFGVEEFLALLPDTGIEEAIELAERLRAAIAATPIDAGDGTVNSTTSIGVASFERDADAAALLASADEALYQAKRSGKNRVVLAGPPRAT